MAEKLSDREQGPVANCAELWGAGELKLRPLAAHHRTAVTRLAPAENLAGALWRSDVVGGPYGPARGAWELLAETTLLMLRETAGDPEAAVDALVMASEMYEDAENINTAAIRDQKSIVISAQDYAPAGESR
jgi:hypothetical protein